MAATHICVTCPRTIGWIWKMPPPHPAVCVSSLSPGRFVRLGRRWARMWDYYFYSLADGIASTGLETGLWRVLVNVAVFLLFADHSLSALRGWRTAGMAAAHGGDDEGGREVREGGGGGILILAHLILKQLW